MKKTSGWYYDPRPRPGTKVPEALKTEMKRRADELVEAFFKPRFVLPPPKDLKWNYIVDIYALWHGPALCFCAKYACPGPNAISPFFETRFARIQYSRPGHFLLSYMRHTGQWWTVHADISLDECFQSLRDEPIFWP